MISVECTFQADGRVRVRRVELNGRWYAIEQGRQWVDREGRHVLVMLNGSESRELLLRSDTMTWENRPVGNRHVKLV